MATEQAGPDGIEPITDEELELVGKFQQYFTVGQHRRQIWLADLAKELLLWRRAAASPGTIVEAPAELKEQALKTRRRWPW